MLTFAFVVDAAYIPSHLGKQTRNNYLRIFTEVRVNSTNENTDIREKPILHC